MLTTDADGRFLWTVSWGRPGRHDWQAVHVWAFDADEALVAIREAHPHRPPPQHAFLAADHTARAALAGEVAALR